MAIMRSVSSCSVLFVLSMSCPLAAGCDRWTSLANITKETITDNWPEQYLEAITAANKGDCRESWNSLWPLAKRGDRNAIYLLSEMLLEGMEITVNSNYKKDAFLFYLYSLGSRDAYSIYISKSNPKYHHSEFIKRFEKQDLGEWSQVYQCIKNNHESDCLKEYKEKGIIPNFNKFTSDIERQIKNYKTISGCHIFLG